MSVIREPPRLFLAQFLDSVESGTELVSDVDNLDSQATTIKVTFSLEVYPPSLPFKI